MRWATFAWKEPVLEVPDLYKGKEQETARPFHKNSIQTHDVWNVLGLLKAKGVSLRERVYLLRRIFQSIQKDDCDECANILENAAAYLGLVEEDYPDGVLEVLLRKKRRETEEYRVGQAAYENAFQSLSIMRESLEKVKGDANAARERAIYTLQIERYEREQRRKEEFREQEDSSPYLVD